MRFWGKICFLTVTIKLKIDDVMRSATVELCIFITHNGKVVNYQLYSEKNNLLMISFLLISYLAQLHS